MYIWMFPSLSVSGPKFLFVCLLLTVRARYFQDASAIVYILEIRDTIPDEMMGVKKK